MCKNVVLVTLPIVVFLLLSQWTYTYKQTHTYMHTYHTCIALHCIALHCIALHYINITITTLLHIHTCVYVYIYMYTVHILYKKEGRQREHGCLKAFNAGCPACESSIPYFSRCF